VYYPCQNVVSFLHANRSHFYECTQERHSNQWTRNPLKSYLLLGNSPLIHQSLGRPHSPPQRAARSPHAVYIIRQQNPKWLQWDARASSPQYCHLPLGDLHSRLLPHPWNQPTHHPSDIQNNPVSSFFHNTPDRQTDRHSHRPTDGLGDITCTNSLPAYARRATRLIIWLIAVVCITAVCSGRK